MSGRLPTHEHFGREHKDSEDISQLAERLAPPEETGQGVNEKTQARDDAGAIVVNTGSLKLPTGLDDREAETRRWIGIEPVILVIVVMMLAFISFITYLIYHMPQPVK